MSGANESTESMDLSPFEKIDFPEIHRKTIKRMQESDLCNNEKYKHSFVGRFLPGDPYFFSMKLDSELGRALAKVGMKTRPKLWSTLQKLPSLFSAERYGEELMEILRKRREGFI